MTIAGAPRYTLTIADSANGSITVVNATETAGDGTPLFYEGDWVMLSVVPNQGYLLKSLTVVQDRGRERCLWGRGRDVFLHPAGRGMSPSAPSLRRFRRQSGRNVRVEGVYVYDGSEQTADVRGVDASMNITGDTGTNAGDYTVVVTSRTGQWADGSTDAVTAAWRIERAGQSAPAGLRSTAPGTEGGSDGKITGVDTRMEYRAEQGAPTQPASAVRSKNLPAGNYFVRYAEDRNHFVSPDAEVSVGGGRIACGLHNHLRRRKRLRQHGACDRQGGRQLHFARLRLYRACKSGIQGVGDRRQQNTTWETRTS